MTGETHTPAGYCPCCGYRIDPGRCPECGKLVSAKTLLRIPPRKRFRRRAITLAIVILAAALLGGADRLVSSGAWRRYVPTAVLLWLQDDGYRSNFAELARRYQAGKLTSAQVQQLFGGILEPRANFELIDPHPAHVPIRVKFDIAFADLALARRLRASGLPRIWVDDRPIDARTAPPPNSRNAWNPPRPIQTWGEIAVLPGLPAGRHTLVFTQDLLDLTSAPLTTAATPIWTLHVSQSITVVDQPASAFAKAASRDEAGTIRGEIQLKPDPPQTDRDGPIGRVIPLRFANIPAPIIGTLEVRLDTERTFRFVKHIVYDGARQFRDSIDLSGMPGISAARHVDVRIRPGSPELAVEYGMRTYYGQVIEWSDVLLAVNIPASEAAPGLAPVVAFLERFGRLSGAPYRSENGRRLRFGGQLAVLPAELEQDLREDYPEYRFSVGRMRYSGGRNTGPINLLIVADGDSGEIRTYATALWLAAPAASFGNTFSGKSCRDVRAVVRRARTLASLLSYVMDGEIDEPAVNMTDGTVDVGIYWQNWSMDKPYRTLRFRFDEHAWISRVDILSGQ